MGRPQEKPTLEEAMALLSDDEVLDEPEKNPEFVSLLGGNRWRRSLPVADSQ